MNSYDLQGFIAELHINSMIATTCPVLLGDGAEIFVWNCLLRWGFFCGPRWPVDRKPGKPWVDLQAWPFEASKS